MRILFIGDIFASAGRAVVGEKLKGLCQSREVDLVIANAENAAGGFGVTPAIATELFALGIDVMTTGNHVWDRREVYGYLDTNPRLLRPANYPPGTPGSGVYVAEARAVACAVINLQGRTHMQPIDCPFRKADEILASLPPEVRVRFVDFHAEATSEKMAMAWYLDGRVSAVIGTHTHVPTADARVLPGGTAYQTDTGMTGPYDSVIGVEREAILHRFLTSMPVKMEAAQARAELRGALIDVDESTGKARSIEPLAIAR
jgi:metallophosphoesterase (TIGR00282 family)